MWEIDNDNIKKETEKIGEEIKNDMNLAILKVNEQNEKIKNINDNKFKELDNKLNEGKEYQNIIDHGVFSGIKNFFTDLFTNDNKKKKKNAIKKIIKEEKNVQEYQKEKEENIKNIEKDFEKKNYNNYNNSNDDDIDNLQKQANELDDMAKILLKNIKQSNEHVDILDKKMDLYENKVKLATANNKYLLNKIKGKNEKELYREFEEI